MRRNSSGITKSFDTMIAKAIVDTITMPLAAEVPPKNASKAISLAPTDIGTLIT